MADGRWNSDPSIFYLLSAFFISAQGGLLGGWWLLRREPRAAGNSPAETAPKPYDKQLAKAAFAEPYRLKRTGHWAESIPLFEEALREFPDHADGYHGLAQSQRELGQTEAALLNHGRAIALEPRRGGLYWDRGETYLRVKNYDAAIADFKTALEKSPNFGRAYRSLGEAYRGQGDFPTALVQHVKSIELEPDNPSFYHERGITYQKMGEQQFALADFAKERELKKKPK